jgi:spore germination protein GerM
VPRGTRALSFKVRGKTVIVNFSRELEKYGGGSTRLQGMIAQIVYTATDVPGIEKAWIWMEGEKELVLGGEGLILDRPLGRKEVSY